MGIKEGMESDHFHGTLILLDQTVIYRFKLSLIRIQLLLGGKNVAILNLEMTSQTTCHWGFFSL